MIAGPASRLLLFALLPLAGGCVPDLEPAVPPCPSPETVRYDQAPAGLVNANVANSVSEFELLSGTWAVQFLCDPTWGGASDGSLTINPTPVHDIQVSNTPRADCGRGDPLWAGTVILSGPSFPGLDGQSGTITGSDPTSFVAQFDASYDQNLSAVWIAGVLGDSATLGALEFALKPQTNSLAGHECPVKRAP